MSRAQSLEAGLKSKEQNNITFCQVLMKPQWPFSCRSEASGVIYSEFPLYRFDWRLDCTIIRSLWKSSQNVGQLK